MDLSKKEFIESILHTPVASFVVGEGCKKGDNVAGSLKSIVATTEAGETISAVIKTFPPKDSPTYSHMKETQVFRTEADAYTIMVTELEKFVNSREGQKTPYRIPMPKHYAHFNDDENDYICLEDIRPEGFIMPIVFNGLSYPDTSFVLTELARFHAFTYALIRQQGEQLFGKTGKLFRFDPERMMNKQKLKEWEVMLSGSVGNAIELIRDINPSLAKVMEQEIPPEKSAAIMNAIRTLTDIKFFPCIVHGDFWSNNLLLKYQEPQTESSTEKKPVAVKFVDFQFTHRGNIFEDLVYFMFTSTDTEFRKRYLDRVLRDYYISFKNALKEINFPMPINFTLGSLIDTFNSLAKASLVNMCFAIPLQMGKPLEPQEPPAGPGQLNKNGGLSVDEKKEEGHESLGGAAGNANEPPNAEDQAIFFLQMFVQQLKPMMAGSPPAMKRLEEITEEVLVSGRF